jgi:hypothetical protein
MRWVGHVTCTGEMSNACRILAEKPEQKRLLGIPRHGWENNIVIDLREIRFGGVDWIQLTQGRD